MKYILVLSTCCVALSHFIGDKSHQTRYKRDAVGALDIVTNNSPAIHAEVKHDNADVTEKVVGCSIRWSSGGQFLVCDLKSSLPFTAAPLRRKMPCPKNNFPSNIEMGTVFQVTPPKDSFFSVQSLRKSWPLVSKVDVIRSVSRLITLIVLLFAAAVEIWSVVNPLYHLLKFIAK